MKMNPDRIWAICAAEFAAVLRMSVRLVLMIGLSLLGDARWRATDAC